MPPFTTLTGDAAVVSCLQEAHNQVMMAIEAELKRKKVSERSFEDHVKIYKERTKKRKQDLADITEKVKIMESNIKNMFSFKGKSFCLEEGESGDERRRTELEIKLQRWQLKEIELKREIEILQKEKSEEDLLLTTNKEAIDENGLEDLVEEMELIREANDMLKSQKEILQLKTEELQLCLEDQQLTKGEIGARKGELGKKVRDMATKTKKNSERYWELLATQQSIDAELKNIDQQMEDLRVDNLFLQQETDQLELLERGLDEQEKINIMLEDKLRTLNSKLNGDQALPFIREQTTPSKSRKSPNKQSASKSYVAKIAPTSKSSTIIKKNNEKIIDLERKAEELKQLLVAAAPNPHPVSEQKLTQRKRSLATVLKSLQ